MTKRPSARLLILEALVKLGPSAGIDVLKESQVPKGSLYAGLEDLLSDGFVTSDGEGERRVWAINEEGKAVAHALRVLQEAGE